MFSASNRTARALAALAGAAGMLALASGAHAQSIVVKSTGPSASGYPVGKKLPANARVTLRAGDKLTVLDKAGSRVLSGPGSFTLDGTVARDTGATARLAGVVGGVAPRTRTGAVRGAPAAGAATKPAPGRGLWQLDVSKGGTFCVADPRQLVLWRADAGAEAATRIAPASGAPVDVTWAKGAPLRLWPVALPVTEGARYTLSGTSAKPVSLTLHVLSVVPADSLAAASLLAEKGCTGQLEVFANAATAVTGG